MDKPTRKLPVMKGKMPMKGKMKKVETKWGSMSKKC